MWDIFDVLLHWDWYARHWRGILGLVLVGAGLVAAFGAGQLIIGWIAIGLGMLFIFWEIFGWFGAD